MAYLCASTSNHCCFTRAWCEINQLPMCSICFLIVIYGCVLQKNASKEASASSSFPLPAPGCTESGKELRAVVQLLTSQRCSLLKLKWKKEKWASRLWRWTAQKAVNLYSAWEYSFVCCFPATTDTLERFQLFGSHQAFALGNVREVLTWGKHLKI